MDSKLKETLADVFGVKPGDITPELTRYDLETWDSLKQMDLVMSLERAYDLSLEIQDIMSMTTVANIIKVLEDKGVQFES